MYLVFASFTYPDNVSEVISYFLLSAIMFASVSVSVRLNDRDNPCE